MRLVSRIERDGSVLFRWRGFLPLALIPAVLAALGDSVRVEMLLGARLDDLWMYGCLGLSLTGLFVRCFTVGFVPAGTSGRNTMRQRADRLNTTGLYSIVRNPLYLGNFLILLGMALAIKVWWIVALASLAYSLWIERIVAAEEAYLVARFELDYARWAERTPAFVPRLANWQSPDLPFSWRSVLAREYGGLLTIASAFLFLESTSDLLVEGEAPVRWASEDAVWLVIFAFAVLACAALRLLKKQTRLLQVPGR